MTGVASKAVFSNVRCQRSSSGRLSVAAERPLMLVLLVVGGINTVISLFYYLRVLKVMTFDPPPEDRIATPSAVWLPGALITALVVPVVVLGVFWSGLYAYAQLAGTFAS